MADMLRNMGMGGEAGGGGMPDLASLMNNPAMMQMAQQMMANGGMERLMSNPAVANMVGDPFVFVEIIKQLLKTSLLDEPYAIWRRDAFYG
jgi:hypothetical protein